VHRRIHAYMRLASIYIYIYIYIYAYIHRYVYMRICAWHRYIQACIYVGARRIHVYACIYIGARRIYACALRTRPHMRLHTYGLS
jgi:hypothetical protein